MKDPGPSSSTRNLALSRQVLVGRRGEEGIGGRLWRDMFSSHGLVLTKGTVFETRFTDGKPWSCGKCQRLEALYACQICLKLGIDEVRFCSDGCFSELWSDHRQLHASIPARNRQLTREHIEVVQRIVEKEGLSGTSDGEIRSLRRREEELVDEVEVFR